MARILNDVFKFSPIKGASNWGTRYISTLAHLSVVQSTDGLFHPHKPVTRAQFVSMTMMTMLHVERLKPWP